MWPFNTINILKSKRVGASATLVAISLVGGGCSLQLIGPGLSSHGIATLSSDVLPLYSVTPHWMDYVQVANTSVACTGSETGFPNPCVHSGERKVVTVSGVSSCSGLTMTDALGVFNWTCSATGAKVQFTSRLNPVMGLTDLITSTPAWAKDSVTLFQNGVAVSSSPSEVWWTNPVVGITPNATTQVTLSNSGTINVVTSSGSSYGYAIAADKVGLITLSNVTVSYVDNSGTCNGTNGSTTATDSLCVVTSGASSGTRNFVWIEGNYDATNNTTPNTNTYGILLGSSKFSVVNRVNLSNIVNNANNSTALMLSGSSYCRTTNFRIANSNTGFFFNNTTYSYFQNAYIYNNSDKCFFAQGSSSGNSGVSAVCNSVNYIPVWLDGATVTDNNFLQMTLVNTNAPYSVYFQGSTGNLLHQVVTANVGAGVDFNLDTSSVISQSVVWNTSTAVSADDGTSDSILGNFLYGSNTSECNNTGGSGSNFDSSCNPSPASAFNQVSGVSLNNSFVGMVTSTDSSNSTNTLGVEGFATTLDWFHFSNSMRSWGLYLAATWPDGVAAEFLGQCTSGTCQIWDWSLSASDTVIRNTSGDGVHQNAAFVSGQTCPAQAAGSVTLIDPRSGNPYMENAVEILGTGGNDNGLCETGETCLYTPNFGAYQGHGTLAQCEFVNGSGSSGISNVTMWGYTTNGR